VTRQQKAMWKAGKLVYSFELHGHESQWLPLAKR
jgi:hypothetical protein